VTGAGGRLYDDAPVDQHAVLHDQSVVTDGIWPPISA
jgi:hypothetical protein